MSSVLGYYEIDSIDEIDINITKEVYNIDDPSKRQSDFTKTIEIPGSKGNDFLFKSLFDVSYSIVNDGVFNYSFNPSVKAECMFYQDTLQQISGYCQLNEIRITDNNKVVYVLTIYGKNIDIFSRLNQLTLNDLTTLGTAVWDDTEIIDSWAASFDPTIKMTYPMLDRGMSRYGRFPDPITKLSYNFEAFKPWFYVKHIIDAIFAEAGVTLEVASFFESTQFKKLILECDVRKFQQDQTLISSTLVEASRNTTQALTPVSNANAGDASLIWDKQIIWNIESSDPSAQYDNTTGTFTMVEDAYTNFISEWTAHVTHTATGAVQFTVVRKRAGAYNFIGWLNAAPVMSGSATTLDVPFRIDVDSAYLLAGDEIRICLSGYTVNSDLTQVSINSSGNYFKQFQDGQINYGQTFNIADVLPDMKQSDFLMGIIKMFNLYMSPIYETGVVIEPRDTYYTDDIVDWTYKLDTSKDFVIKPQGLLENKEIVFTYTENGDDLSKAFKQATDYTHGYNDVIFSNDFVKDKKTCEIPFTLIPLQKEIGDNNVMMRTIFDGRSQEKSVKPIIAYFGGMQPGTFRYWLNAGSYTDYTTYPFAGHIDDLIAPNYDLCFGEQPLYFYTTPTIAGLNITTNNLYNQFHYRQWTEVGDKDSKLVEAYFKLTPNDISQLDFRKTYWIENNAYRLLKVEDYAPNSGRTTLCKLLKLVYQTPYDVSVVTQYGGNGQGGQTGGGGVITDGSGGTDDLRRGVVTPDGNTIGATAVGILVNGKGNTIAEQCGTITIHGNDNVIMPGVTNVTLINTDGLTITESNVLYIDGIKVNVGSPTNGQVWSYNSTTNEISFTTVSGSGLTDGDYGDITLSGGATVWTIDNGVVTLAKMADVATGSVFYRKTAGTGAPEVQTLATLKTDLGLTGTNSGDQTSIVGISGTKAEFDAAVSDGNILYVGDVTSNATHTGEVTGSGALTMDKTSITNRTNVTAAVGDSVMISDVSDSDNLKKVTIQSIIDLAGGGMTWNEVATTSDTIVVNNGYITNNAGEVTLTLPAAAAVGDVAHIVGSGAGGWKVAQNASQVIIWDSGAVVGVNQTTTGVTGYINSSDRYDSVELICITANTTWVVKNSKGNINLV